MIGRSKSSNEQKRYLQILTQLKQVISAFARAEQTIGYQSLLMMVKEFKGVERHKEARLKSHA